jgi:uncharacterized Zn finger protein (UPF0148 family)
VIRETGAAKAPALCPTCSGPLQVVDSTQGSASYCPVCGAKPAREHAAEGALPRVTGTNIQESR